MSNISDNYIFNVGGNGISTSTSNVNSNYINRVGGHGAEIGPFCSAAENIVTNAAGDGIRQHGISNILKKLGIPESYHAEFEAEEVRDLLLEVATRKQNGQSLETVKENKTFKKILSVSGPLANTATLLSLLIQIFRP